MLSFGLHSYKESLFVAANFYLSLGLALGLFGQREVAADFEAKSSYLFDDGLFLNAVFEDFAAVYLDVGLEELLPYIQYSAAFYGEPPQPTPRGFHSGQPGEKSRSAARLPTMPKQKPAWSKECKDAGRQLAALRRLRHVHEPAIFDFAAN